MVISKDLDKLLDNLPFFIKESLNNNFNKEKLIEIVLDLGRRPEVHFITGPKYLSQKVISCQDIDYVIKRYSKCISKSTDNFLNWLTQDYKKRLRTNIRTNFESIKNKK